MRSMKSCVLRILMSPAFKLSGILYYLVSAHFLGIGFSSSSGPLEAFFFGSYFHRPLDFSSSLRPTYLLISKFHTFSFPCHLFSRSWFLWPHLSSPLATSFIQYFDPLCQLSFCVFSRFQLIFSMLWVS